MSGAGSVSGTRKSEARERSPFKLEVSEGESRGVDSDEPAPGILHSSSDTHELCTKDVSTSSYEILQELRSLRAGDSSWRDVRPFISHHAPTVLQAIHCTPDLRDWLVDISTPSQLLDVVERIGGPIEAQFRWLASANLKAAPAGWRREDGLLERAEPLLDRLDHYRSIAVLEASLKATQSEELSLRRSTPAAGQHSVYRYYRDKARPLEEQRRHAIAEAGLTEQAWSDEKDLFRAVFRAHALHTTLHLLKASAERIEDVRAHYRGGLELQALRADVASLAEKQRQIDSLRMQLFRPASREQNQATELANRLLSEESDFAVLRSALSRKHALVSDPDLELASIAQSLPNARAEVERIVRKRLSDIEKISDQLATDTTLVFRLDRVLEHAKASLGIRLGSTAALLVAEEVESLNAIEDAKNTAFLALSLALGLASGFGGATALSSSSAGTSLAAMATVDAVQKYSIELSASSTDFDRARAIASERPSAIWLAIDVASFVIDAGAFARSFGAVSDAAISVGRASTRIEHEQARSRLAHEIFRIPSTVARAPEAFFAAALEAAENQRTRAAVLANAREAQQLRAGHPQLERSAIAELLSLSDQTRAALLAKLVARPHVINNLALIMNGHASVRHGIQRLFDFGDGSIGLDILEELSSWRSASKARELLDRLGGPRVAPEHLAEIEGNLRKVQSTSARTARLEVLSRELLPIRPNDAERISRKYRVPVLLNRDVSGRDTRVSFVATRGRIDDVQLEIGAGASLHDVELHLSTVERLAVYRGLLGRASTLLDNVREWRGHEVLRPGQAAFRAALELEKLPAVIRSRELELSGAITAERIASLEADIASLKAQLSSFEQAVAKDLPELEIDYVAALSPEAFEQLRLERARSYPDFAVVSALEGKTLGAVESNAELKRRFEEFYRVDRNEVIYRRESHIGDVPMLRLEHGAEPVTLRFTPLHEPEPPIPLPRGTPAEVEAFVVRNSESWARWRTALLGEQIINEADIAALVANVLSTKNAPTTVQKLRDALKIATRDQIVLSCFRGAKSGAESYQRLRNVALSLNPADQGSISERWYLEHTKRFRGVDLQPHPDLWRATDGGMKVDRRPDNFNVVTGELGEVKSSKSALQKRDLQQIEDTLVAMMGEGLNTKDQVSVRAYRLTFLDPKAAFDSASPLVDWFKRFSEFRLEVFDRKGELHVVNARSLRQLREQKRDLRSLLEEWVAK